MILQLSFYLFIKLYSFYHPKLNLFLSKTYVNVTNGITTVASYRRNVLPSVAATLASLPL